MTARIFGKTIGFRNPNNITILKGVISSLRGQKEAMNKEQVKHWTDVLKDIAIGQFLFFGGKNLYLYTKDVDYDVVILILSGMLYLVVHVIIHIILSELED